MNNLLHIHSSANLQNSTSRQIGGQLVQHRNKLTRACRSTKETSPFSPFPTSIEISFL